MTKNPIPNPDYKHNPGGDDLVELPEELKYLEEKGITAHKYGQYVLLKGPGYDTAALDEILGKIKNQESVVIVITGPPGTGKTYLGLFIGQLLDPKFHVTDVPPPDPSEDDGQVAFEREHIMYLTGANSPLKRKQVVQLDEGHFGIGARGWHNSDQQDTTNYIAAIRSKGFVLILIVLNTQMIDKMVRDFVVNYEIRVNKRGQGIVYRRWFPQFGNKVYKKRIGKLTVPLPDAHLCSFPTCLDCKHMKNGSCKTIRAIYERRKEHFLNQQSETKPGKEKTSKTTSQRVEMIWSQKPRLTRTSHGNISMGIIQLILEENGEPHGENIARETQRAIRSIHKEETQTLPIE